MGEPPNLYPLHFPPGKWASSAAEHLGSGPCAPTNSGLEAVQWESPERAQPSLVGAWGYPPTSTRSTSRQGSGRVPQPSTWGHGHAPLRTRGGRRSGGRVQRGRSRPLWWRMGVPSNLYPLHFSPGKWASSAAEHLGSGPCTPTNSGLEAVQWESPERAQPSLVGAWGYPPQTLSAPLPAREVGGSSRVRDWRRSGGG